MIRIRMADGNWLQGEILGSKGLATDLDIIVQNFPDFLKLKLEDKTVLVNTKYIIHIEEKD